MIDIERLWRARLILEDGTIWKATSIGAEGETGGEVVFNTALSGYQEVLTDPSYAGQIVCMTYPEIGNYGVCSQDEESEGPKVAGFLVRSLAPRHSNWRATEALGDYLRRHGIVALEGIDTRALTRKVRTLGAMKIFMTTEPLSDDELRERLAAVPELVDRDLVSGVTRAAAGAWTDGFETAFHADLSPEGSRRPKVVAFDFGAKSSIFRSLVAVGCDVVVVPAATDFDTVMSHRPDGVFLSNGPGDPRLLTGVVDTVRELLGKVPIFGICLGHQILALAAGAEIVKMKFGHHGSNHPVKDLDTGRVEITAQNHGFAATRESILAAGGRITHVNLNDDSVSGLELPAARAFSVQYHPEASPGPHDSAYLFRRFVQRMADGVGAGS
ncbi:MAG: glutamine-hydrolyzing carbamoyl-phosphate synthase small subunit [Planctomycetota bacterium]